MRFIPAPVSRKQVISFTAMVSGPYAVRDKYVGLAANAMSDYAEGNGNVSYVGTVEELVLRSERLTCDNIAANKTLSCSGVFSGFAELSCCFRTALSCRDVRGRGALYATFGRVFSSNAFVQWPSHFSLFELQSYFAASGRRWCSWRMSMTFLDDFQTGYIGSWNGLCSMAAFCQSAFA